MESDSVNKTRTLKESMDTSPSTYVRLSETQKEAIGKALANLQEQALKAGNSWEWVEYESRPIRDILSLPNTGHPLLEPTPTEQHLAAGKRKLRPGEPVPPAGPEVSWCASCGGCYEWGGNGVWHHAGCSRIPNGHETAWLEAPPAPTSEVPTQAWRCQASGGRLDADWIVRKVAEISDRNSPVDWPEVMLVTADELRSIILAAPPAGRTLTDEKIAAEARLMFPKSSWQVDASFRLGVKFAEKHYGIDAASPARDILTGKGAKHESLSESQAAHDVLTERQRQICIEGWTLKHDDAHDAGELSSAASAYALAASDSLNPYSQGDGYYDALPPLSWPWDQTWWKPGTDPRRMLVKAGALILAEIERLDRANSSSIANGQVKSRSQCLREAGFTRRLSVRSLPSDE